MNSSFMSSSFGVDIDPTDGALSHAGSIGDILRRHKGLTLKQVEEVVLLQRERGIKFGEAAVALKYASEKDVLWALGQQFHYPYSSQWSNEVSDELVVAANPFGDQAETFRDIRSQVMLTALSGEDGRRALAVISPDVGDNQTASQHRHR